MVLQCARNSILLNSDCKILESVTKKHVEYTYLSYETIASSKIRIAVFFIRYVKLPKKYGHDKKQNKTKQKQIQK